MLCGVLAVLPEGSLFGMPFVCPPTQESRWQEVWSTTTLFESSATGLAETPRGISSPASPLDTLSFAGEVSSPQPREQELNPNHVSSKDGSLLVSLAFADTGWNGAMQRRRAVASGHSLEAWRMALAEMALDENRSPFSPQDAKGNYSLLVFLAGLVLLTVGAVVRRVRRPVTQEKESRPVSKPRFPVWHGASAPDGGVRLNNHPKAPIPPLEQ